MEVFFYGLFMDIRILEQKGIRPANPRKGYLKDYALKIGNRASLIPSKNETSYGMVMTVDGSAILDLYSEASVADYMPEEVNIIAYTGASIKATCYNLPAESLSGTNPVYADALYKLAMELEFPKEYLEKIKQMTKSE